MSLSEYIDRVWHSYLYSIPTSLAAIAAIVAAIALRRKAPGAAGFIWAAAVIGLIDNWVYPIAYEAVDQILNNPDSIHSVARAILCNVVNILSALPFVLLLFAISKASGGSLPGHRRPGSVTVVAWINIVLSVLALGALLWLIQDLSRSSSRFFYAVLPVLIAYCVACLVQVGLFVAMLYGKNWARLLYLWLFPISFGIGLIAGTLRVGSMIGLAIYGIYAIVLTRSTVVVFFTQRPQAPSPHPSPPSCSPDEPIAREQQSAAPPLVAPSSSQLPLREAVEPQVILKCSNVSCLARYRAKQPLAGRSLKCKRCGSLLSD